MSQDEFVKEGFTQVNATSLKAYVMSQIDNVNSDQESDFETGGEDEDEDHAFRRELRDLKVSARERRAGYLAANATTRQPTPHPNAFPS
ncbi:hypothetical protein RI054_24g102090 [Pseudoscourfieldia marina]